MKKSINICIPFYNENNLDIIIFKLIDIINSHKNFSFQITLLDDGSKVYISDDFFDTLKKRYSKIQIYRHSKNYGKEISLYNLLNLSKNFDYFITLDSDMQHPPELINEMIELIEKNKNINILTQKKFNLQSFFRTNFTKLFYQIINKFFKFNLKYNFSDFCMLNNEIINKIDRHNKGIFIFKGFLHNNVSNYRTLFFNINFRYSGKSNYSSFKLFRLSLDYLYFVKPNFFYYIAFILFLFSIYIVLNPKIFFIFTTLNFSLLIFYILTLLVLISLFLSKNNLRRNKFEI